MPTFTSNPTSTYLLQFAGVPLLLDQARVIRLNQPHAEQEDTANLPPRKHQPLEDLCDELDRIMPWSVLQDFHLPTNYPGRNLGAIARQEFRGPYPDPNIKLNSWYYPPTATQWSVFRGLATSTAVQAMLEATTSLTIPAGSMTSTLTTDIGRDRGTMSSATFTSTQATTQNANPGLFTMLANPLSPDNPSFDASLYTLNSSMFLLPPRPLAEHGGQFDGLYLITLVDERYWWQYTPVFLHPTNKSTWDGLIQSLVAELNITLSFDPTPSVYGQPEPDSQLWTNFENAGVLLDALAYNTGRIVVRLLDGTYVLRSSLDSQAIININRLTAPKLVRTAGGDIFYSGNMNLQVGDLGPSRNTVLPDLVNVTFPVYITGDDPIPHFSNPRYQNQRPSAWYEESFGEVFNVPVPIASGKIDVALGGTSGYTHHIATTAKALFATESADNPLNDTGLTNLAMRLGQDYYQGQVTAALDETYPGTLAWIPEGVHDLIWTYSARSRQATTRVMKTQWNQYVREMQHATPALPGFSNTPKGVGGPSVAQTIRDSLDNTPIPPQITPIATTLAVAATATDTSLTFKAIDYLPTQNRWRGQVDNEIILFEGTNPGTVTSQGVVVQVVYRGIDGTLAAAHAQDAQISQIAPDVGYGINLTTYEKSQFVYPAEWTSGGIQGMNIVPQMQTVQVLDNVGTKINKIQHYSGRVQTYDTTMQSGFQWFNEELIWAVERSAGMVLSGGRYDGQILGYSASGMVAPVYAIGDASTPFAFNSPGGGGGTGSLIVEDLVGDTTVTGGARRVFLASGITDITLNRDDGLNTILFTEEYGTFLQATLDKPAVAVAFNLFDAAVNQKGAVSLNPQMLGRSDKYFHDDAGLFNQQFIFWGGDQSVDTVPLESTLMLADDGTTLNPLPPGTFPTPPFWGVFFVNSSQIYLSTFDVGGGGSNTGRTRFTIKSQNTVLAIPNQINAGDGIAYEIIDQAGNDFVGCNVPTPSRVTAVGGIVVGYDNSPTTLTAGDIAQIAEMISLRA